MTVLTHRILDSQGQPVAGLVASVALYDPVRSATPGTFQRSRGVSATSDDTGLLRWVLPRPARPGITTSYVITGIEDRQVLVSVPLGVSTATVNQTRTGTLPILGHPAPTLDLVTQQELATRLAGLTADLPSGAGAALTSPGGLEVAVAALDLDGWTFTGGTATLPGAGTWHVGVDLFTKQIRTLPRPGHRGWVPVGHAVATATKITALVPVPPVLPSSRLPRTLGKLLASEPVSVVVMGSSLTASGGGGNDWPGMVFGAGSVSDYRLPGTITAQYTGIGGSPNSYQLAQTGLSGWHNSASYYNAGMAARNRPGAGRSQLFEDVDLVVLGVLANGGEQRLGIIEATVRNLRKRGVEVLLVTDNPQGPGLDYDTMSRAALYVDGPVVQRVAERYGCEFADTAAYVFEGYFRQGGNGVYASGDPIHQQGGEPHGRTSPTVVGGHELWARAVRSVFTLDGEQQTGELFPQGSFDDPAEVGKWFRFGDFSLDFTIADGKLTATVPADATSRAGMARDLTGIVGGNTYTVTFTVSRQTVTDWEAGFLRNYSWAPNGSLDPNGTGPHSTVSTVPDSSGESTYSLIFWSNPAPVPGAMIEFESISVQGVGGIAIIDLAPHRARTAQLLPSSRIVTDSQIPGDAFVMLPQDEVQVSVGQGGTLSAHPWGATSFARRFSSRTEGQDLLTLAVGQRLVISGTNADAFALIRFADETDAPVTVDVATGGNLWRTMTFDPPAFGNEWMTFIMLPSEIRTTFTDPLGYHTGVTLTVTAGTLRVAGLVAFTPEQDYIDPEDIRRHGTWTYGFSRSGVDGYWSDTVGDRLSYVPSGRRLFWELSGNPGSRTADLESDVALARDVSMAGNYHVTLPGLPGSPGARHWFTVKTAAPGSAENGWSAHCAGAVVVHDR